MDCGANFSKLVSILISQSQYEGLSCPQNREGALLYPYMPYFIWQYLILISLNYNIDLHFNTPSVDKKAFHLCKNSYLITEIPKFGGHYIGI